MYSFLRRLRALFGKRSSTRKVARRPRFRPELCQLEDRVVPTVAFTPQFGAEYPAASANGAVLNNPSVVLIFWGDYWLNPTGVTDTDVILAAKNVVNSTYSDRLSQYGSFGRGTISDFHFDDSVAFTPSNGLIGFSDLDLNQIANRWMSSADVQAAPSDRSIYFIVTPSGRSR
jgi:hypothetical protein